ncbi:MAG TPA: hypothetical protein VFB42_13000 [Gaiellaceae bacterium]|nr:hypothetical protein [Gaiellaceae bacterium]
MRASLALAWAILAEASLSFLGLGLGPPPPTASLGQTVGEGGSLAGIAWWTLAGPSIAIVIAVIGLDFLGGATVLVRAADDGHERAVVEPAVSALLEGFDERVRHFEVAARAGRAGGGAVRRAPGGPGARYRGPDPVASSDGSREPGREVASAGRKPEPRPPRRCRARSTRDENAGIPRSGARRSR